MVRVHWVLRPVLMALCAVQAVLALLAYSRGRNTSLLVHGVSSAVVAVVQIPNLLLEKTFAFLCVLITMSLYGFYIGTNIWLLLSVVNHRVRYPPHFGPVEYLMALATIILISMSVTILWMDYFRTNGKDTESMNTVCQLEKLPKVPIVTDTLEVLASLNNKASEGTLVVDLVDDRTLHLIHQALMADLELYESGDNWMAPKTLLPSNYTPNLKQRCLPLSMSLRLLEDQIDSQKTENRWDKVGPEIRDKVNQNDSEGQEKEVLIRDRSPEQCIKTPGNQSADDSTMYMQKVRKETFRWLDQSDCLLCVHESQNISSCTIPKPSPLHTELTNPIAPNPILIGMPELAHRPLVKYPSYQDITNHSEVSNYLIFHSMLAIPLTVPEESESPTRFSMVLDGLEDIPQPIPQWDNGTQRVTLEQWEANKSAWLAQSHLTKPILYSVNNLIRSASAPSLHTYRQVSESSHPSSNETFAPVTPVVTSQQEDEVTSNSSPIRKMMGIFKKRDSEDTMIAPSHNHTQSVTNSMASFLVSVASGKSSRSNSPRKAIKSLFSRSPLYEEFPARSFPRPNYKHQSMLLNFKMEPDKPDLWDTQTYDHSEGSRVSSIPSAIIGEYDKEKWRTLKELERQAENDL